MKDNWANKIARLMVKEETASPLMFAKVVSLSPLSLEISGEVLKKYIFKTSSANSFKIGDTVIVLREQNEFYILSKVLR